MKCILFGAGGREAIIASELAKKYELYAVISHKNPTIIEAVEKTGGKYYIEKKPNEEFIKKVIKENDIELCVVNSDNLLQQGVIDVAKSCGILTFGPTSEGAKIEWNKAYALSVMEKLAPEMLNPTKIIENEEELKKVIDEYDDVEFVVKPNGLTGGKGVKVGGEHFKSKEEGYNYALGCLKQDKCVIIQDKMVGHEFTIMGFTNGKDVVLAPCTYDHPYRFEGDQGPGTGGMGVVTFKDGLMPFLTKEDMKKCKEVMEKVVREINKEKIIFNGVIYGGFFKTQKGIFFIEFNSRLGDPEALNVLSLMKTPFAEVALDIAKGNELNEKNCNFEEKASYVVYVVSKSYAIDSKAEPIEFKIDENILNNNEIKVYCSSMEQIDANKYKSVGNSRLFALTKTGDDLEEIKEFVNGLLKKYVERDILDYRLDLGEFRR